MNNNIEHIFFDLDHTLWDFDKNSALTFDFIFKKNNLQLSLPEFLSVYEPLNLQYWKLYREEKVSKEHLRFYRLKDTFDTLNIEVEAEVINKLSEDYIDNLSNQNHLFDGTFEILDYLKPKYQLHIITNGFEAVQYHKMKKSNIFHFFETITNSEMVGVKKPNPKIFNHALDLANATTKNSIMIGDNYEADILGALNIGLDAICFNYHKETIAPDIKIINHLLDLKKYL
ncbi:YjjG family noncanonical pyrimidine nucleotidase [Mesoflavibacter zeaxanthinifaciens]|uniref:YjjG family noncanonical pyrimidine nucleotidase n=1 Tax=Mesoflavibacter zeaxanthinifaciens TaxID=393060 RepID=UPI000405100F|nr:YjjG family noncanonical pyrimidine nucleotidase [Mesoflavibacter zeaxanthinifaciens]